MLELLRGTIDELAHAHLRALFYVPQVVGAMALTVLLAAMDQLAARRLGLPLLLAILLLAPELCFVCLWYNSSVLALLPAATALFLIFMKPGTSLPDHSRHLLVGCCSALAMLFRLDFALCVPLFAHLMQRRAQQPASALAYFASAFGLVMAVARVTGMVDFGSIMFSAGHGFERAASEMEITRRWSALITLSALSVFAWTAMISYGAWFIFTSLRRRRWSSLAVLIAAVIVCYPLARHVLSPKHLMPALLFVPFVLVLAAREVQDRLGAPAFRWVSAGVVAIALLVQVVTVSPHRWFPFLEFSGETKPVRTADGSRSFGAYLYGFAKIGTPPGDRPDGGFIRLNRRLRQVIEGRPENICIVYDHRQSNFFYNDWSWPRLSLYLQCDGYHVREYAYMDRIVLEKDGRTVEMKFVPPPVEEWPSDDSRATVIRIPFVDRADGYWNEQARLEEIYAGFRERFQINHFTDEAPSVDVR